MKILYSILVALLIGTMPAMAQNEGKGPRFNPEEFNARMENYIMEKACLTQAESDKLFPLYHEMKNKQMEINIKIHQLKHKEANANTTDKEYVAIISKIKDYAVEQANIEKTYFAKMCKAVSAKKVFGVMKAEDQFHREMLRKASPKNDRNREHRHWDDQKRNGNK